MLIDHFGDSICFTYPKDTKKSQMFYSVDIKGTDMAENLRSTDIIKECADLLREECKNFDFNLEGTYNLAEDCSISYDIYTENRPESWVRFFNVLFPYRTKSTPIQRKCDTLFQIFHYVLNSGTNHTPLHVSVAELLHDDSRAKLVIGVLNRLGLCISYDELQRIDYGIMEEITTTAGSNRVPVSLPFNDDEQDTELHGAMDNFDHEEATASGIGGSHDTILMLFKNSTIPNNSDRSFSSKPLGSTLKKRSLTSVLPCQELIRIGKFSGRGKLRSTFSPTTATDLSWKEKELSSQ